MNYLNVDVTPGSICYSLKTPSVYASTSEKNLRQFVVYILIENDLNLSDEICLGKPGKFILNGNKQNLTISSGLFAGLRYLESIEIVKSGLLTIPEDLFWNENILKNLNISHNYLTTISWNNFQLCKKLETIDLSHNLISEFTESLDVSSHLKILDLSENKIKNFPK